ncbi:MAG: tRNA uridine-5-carboxymethylaminomethyl(34) synthesis GTPase MnmE [Cellvibrionaceae bacterium]|nr:tRNA uridine-5-carboxymethylaminomethyl(34) synthesis GTPase MnmE [Cellvibrionaceae bacterium]
MAHSFSDTIAAIATPPGRGSVGIVRLSGPLAKSLGEQFTGQRLKARHAHYCRFYHPQKKTLIDQGLAIFFQAPHSFTGEDILELQGHGGPVVLDQLLKAALSLEGVRQAKPGEFSERAFLNDKIDLAQAEAIADLIDASSEQAARNAMQSLQGVFSEKIHHLVDELTQLRLYIEAAIDFPEEEIDFLADQHIHKALKSLQAYLQDTLGQAKQGLILREGMTVVIAGKPNAGKSSLLNALSGTDTAIVTDIPGTTRDTLKEHIHIDNIPLHIIDTAGLRHSGDQVEQIGVKKAWEAILTADRILVVVDASTLPTAASDLSVPINSETITDLLPSLTAEHSEYLLDPTKITLIYNKADLLPDTAQVFARQTAFAQNPLWISAKTGRGIDALKAHLKNVIGYQQTAEGGFNARRRHLQALEQAEQCINQAYELLQQGTGELLAEELRLAQQLLGDITGHISADDLLGKIFSSFCIGK